MPRPSLKTERQSQILDAYGRCLALYGVEGATLERVASEAGLARALIRHNVGNRDDLLARFVERFLDQSKALTRAMMDSLPDADRPGALIAVLFDPAYTDDQSVRIANALIVAAAERPDLAKSMRVWSSDFTDALEQVFEDRVVAQAIASLYADVEAMAPLGADLDRRALSRRAARRLAGLSDL